MCHRGHYHGLYLGFYKIRTHTHNRVATKLGLGAVHHVFGGAIKRHPLTHHQNMTNQRRQAAEAAAELRRMMEEILGAPAYDEIQAKTEAAAAIEGLEHAEKALRLWRDHEEEAIELLDEEPLDADDDEEVQEALEHVEAAANLLDDDDGGQSSQ